VGERKSTERDSNRESWNHDQINLNKTLKHWSLQKME